VTTADTVKRLNGLRDGLAARDLELDPEHVQFGETFPKRGVIAFAEQWLEMPRAAAPTAVICAYDVLAIEFLRAILQRGVHVPEDVSVVGCDGGPEGALSRPGLTTAKQPSQALGSAARRPVLHLIQSPEGESPAGADCPCRLL